MGEGPDRRRLNALWDRRDLKSTIEEALNNTGIDLSRLTVGDLAPLDQFHAGGMVLTRSLANQGELKAGTRVLDVGGGLGGPARTLAVEFGCIVTLADLAESYVGAAEWLTGVLGLAGKVSHVVADALDLPFESGSFDVVWTQNSCMNIADKVRLHEGFHRLLRAGGRLFTQEPMAGPVQPLIFPVMWAADASTSFLLPPDEMRTLIEAVGFRLKAWEYTKAVKTPAVIEPRVPLQRIQALVMGDKISAIRAARRRNNAEGRIVMVQAVFDKS
jgi:ubiquinone/menaquinone biosynthesis C-methylase UbiE